MVYWYLAVEIVVFIGSVLILRKIYPEFDAGRILRGALRMNWHGIAMVSVAVWMANLWFQSTYSGMDMSLKFEWMKCLSKENSTWVNGFDWEC